MSILQNHHVYNYLVSLLENKEHSDFFVFREEKKNQLNLNSKIILVTGAAGSIGREITIQLSLLNPQKLILVDQAESSLYELQQSFLNKRRKNIEIIVADICDKNRMHIIFNRYRPDIVFHSAAYKHVVLMEKNPYEAIKVNICGTKNMVDLSIKYDVERFLMVSTDKAVNPTSMMGATKRVAELYINYKSKTQKETKFTITRLGNVLGSNGSVIPLFKKQIENRYPLTVTHKEITRYFMTISEACTLILESAKMGNGGEIYIFDMGKAVKIYDIAKTMIHLSGLRYPQDISIEIIGLRLGEKLYEELLTDEENTIETDHPKIRMVKNKDINRSKMLKKIEFFCEKKQILSNKNLVDKLKEIVPEYRPNNPKYENLDKFSQK